MKTTDGPLVISIYQMKCNGCSARNSHAGGPRIAQNWTVSTHHQKNDEWGFVVHLDNLSTVGISWKLQVSEFKADH